ncbi:hypothetical protein THAOC_11836, partial [Thalassiosira oceanica]
RGGRSSSAGRDSRPGGAVGRPGADGAVEFVARVLPGGEPTAWDGRSSAPLELRASYFLSEGAVQEYVVPGDPDSSPRGQAVEITAVGGSGGGCDGGRGEEVTAASPEGDEGDELGNSQGQAGGRVSAMFALQAGERLQVVVGGGGGSTATVSGSLGGKGGYNGGMNGRQDDSSGGGGGGGMTVVSSSRNKVILAAFGGRGGGNTTYCTALGGAGGKMKGKETEGYVDADLVIPETDNKLELDAPGEVSIVSLTHSSIGLSWGSGKGLERRLKKEEYPYSYLVLLAAAANDNDKLVCDIAEYTLHERVLRSWRPGDNSTSNIRGLEHSSTYCIRVEALSVGGLSLGNKTLQFETSGKPVNEWRELRSLDGFASAELGLGGNRTICERSNVRPTPRRGHSLSVVDGSVYIFGGATTICMCEDDSQGEDRCELQDVYSDELWRLDTATGEFNQLKPPPGSLWPGPREQHSATVLANGDVLVIGGVTSEVGGGSKSLLLNDAHVLSNPERTASHRYRGVDVDVRLPQGEITEHALLTVPSRDEEEEMCIHELEMGLQMDHGCPRSIEHVRLGHVDSSGIQRGVKVLVASTESLRGGCEYSFIDLRLSDGADEWILDGLKFPMKGTFRPANSLFGTFRGIPLEGTWSVAIAQSEKLDLGGKHDNSTLVGWELSFVTKPCYPSAKWTTLEVPTDFKPRRLHTAVAVEDSVFVVGGVSNQYLEDVWRYDRVLSRWVELKSAPSEGKSPRHGQAGMLTPGGAVIAFGGLRPNERLEPSQDVWMMDPFDGGWEWRPIPVLGHGTPQVPYSRYLSSFGLLVKDNVGTHAQWQGVAFGGEGKSGSSLYGDAWLFLPGGIEAGTGRAELCEWRVLPFSTADRSWRNSCGYDPRDEFGPPPQGCGLLSIFVRAWCKEQYQSFWL